MIKNEDTNTVTIESIKIAGFASYQSEVKIVLGKKHNFIYGLNGTGKTIISNFLACQSNNTDDDKKNYENCDIKFSDDNAPTNILVYNQRFVERNFLEEGTQKGIFTLDKNNIEAIKAIKEAEDKKEETEEKRNAIDEGITELDKNYLTYRNELKDSIWEYKKKHLNSPGIKKCISSAGCGGDKKKFLDKVLETELIESKEVIVKDKITEIDKQITSLTDSDAKEKPHYKNISVSAKDIELDNIFQEQIVGSANSYMSDMIKKLSDDSYEGWLKKGISQYLDKTENCPFCKQDLKNDLKDKIKEHIDDVYREKLNKLDEYKRSYLEFEESIKNYNSSQKLPENKNFSRLIEKLISEISSNVISIENKIKEPNILIDISETTPIIKKINNVVSDENKTINRFNKQLEDKISALNNIYEEFWNLIRVEKKEGITRYRSVKKKIDKGKAAKSLEKENLVKEISLLEKDIKENNEKTKNVDEAIKWINSQLSHLGMHGFSINKADVESNNDKSGIFYRINRTNENKSDEVFRTLSEGEKTLISFLYFLRLCSGSDDKETSINTKDRVIVIDDPISSLSFNLVFEVACLIKEMFFKDKDKYKQCIILTHHLYFLHEMFTQIKLGNNYHIYRLSKNKDNNSHIEKMSREDIQNPYQEYWRTFVDIKNNNASKHILPNVMRNILEHFFSFINVEHKLEDVFKENHPDSPRFSAFWRYTNKESHSDAINLIDVKDIDTEKWITYFEKIFDETGFLEHYEAMIQKYEKIDASHS